MKPPAEWTERDLHDLPLGEFDWLEIKGRRALDLTVPGVVETQVRENLSKAISALANTGGGVLVLGLQNPADAWRVDDGGVCLTIKGRSTREWLEDVVPELVEHRLRRFNVYVVRQTSSDSQIGDDRGIFLVDVADSDDAPHQAQDLRYYVRVGGKSRPIGHRLVADIFNRARHPQMEVTMTFETKEDVVRTTDQFLRPVEKRVVRNSLSIRATNVGRILAQFVLVVVDLPGRWLPKENAESVAGDNVVRRFRNTRQDVLGGDPLPSPGGMGFRPRYGPSWFDPLLPGLSRTWTLKLHDEAQVRLCNGKIAWTAHADSASTRSGEFLGRQLLEGP